MGVWDAISGVPTAFNLAFLGLVTNAVLLLKQDL